MPIIIDPLVGGHWLMRGWRLRWWLGCAVLGCAVTPASARSPTGVAEEIAQLRAELGTQRRLIDAQTRRIEQQQHEIDALRAPPQVPPLATAADQPRAQPAPRSPSPQIAQRLASTTPSPDQPVGVEPELARVEQQARALPEGLGVLTRAGHIVLESSIEYTASSSNRLVFEGIELIPGIQIGQIDADTADRDTTVAAATARYGLTRNLEVEARVPYLFRSDRTQSVRQQESATTSRFHLHESGIGDIELGLRYQLNRPFGERPIFVASLRVKSDTGKSPYAVSYDNAGTATGLATGSGFWAIQPGLSFLLPSEPAVIFGGVSYIHSIPRDIDRVIGETLISRVHPGDAISGNIGFGFALNPRFSFSLGYEHTYIFPMTWELDGTVERDNRIQIGSLLLGMSYRLTPRQAVNLGFELGATEYAPDVNVILRIPLTPR